MSPSPCETHWVTWPRLGPWGETVNWPSGVGCEGNNKIATRPEHVPKGSVCILKCEANSKIPVEMQAIQCPELHPLNILLSSQNCKFGVCCRFKSQQNKCDFSCNVKWTMTTKKGLRRTAFIGPKIKDGLRSRWEWNIHHSEYPLRFALKNVGLANIVKKLSNGWFPEGFWKKQLRQLPTGQPCSFGKITFVCC